jgi:sulfite exporter TauE/SafE
MALAALAAGGAGEGAAVMGAFALGGAPALLATQLQARLWPVQGRWVAIGRRAIPALAAVVLVWRALAAPAIAATGAGDACH